MPADLLQPPGGFHCRLSGKEKRVGGFDLLWDDGPVMSDDSLDCANNTALSLANSFLGMCAGCCGNHYQDKMLMRASYLHDGIPLPVRCPSYIETAAPSYILIRDWRWHCKPPCPGTLPYGVGSVLM